MHPANADIDRNHLRLACGPGKHGPGNRRDKSRQLTSSSEVVADPIKHYFYPKVHTYSSRIVTSNQAKYRLIGSGNQPVHSRRLLVPQSPAITGPAAVANYRSHACS
jgi:hypothetical protein